MANRYAVLWKWGDAILIALQLEYLMFSRTMCGVMSLDALLLPSERPASSKRTPHHFHHFSSNFRSQLNANHVPGGFPHASKMLVMVRSLATTAGKLIGFSTKARPSR